MFPLHFQRLERNRIQRPDRHPEIRQTHHQTRWALPTQVAGFEFETKFLRPSRDPLPELSKSPDAIALDEARRSFRLCDCQWALKTSHRKALQNQPL